jgi:hypothetical protein
MAAQALEKFKAEQARQAQREKEQTLPTPDKGPHR